MAGKKKVLAEELPKTIVRRLVKDTLSHLSKDGDISLLREALQAFSESSRIFIQYLSATANDICKESKRQIINADDVFRALEEIEFPEFIESLKVSLEEFKRKSAVKRSRSSRGIEAKKSKRKEQPSENGGEEKRDSIEGNKLEDDEEDDAHDGY